MELRPAEFLFAQHGVCSCPGPIGPKYHPKPYRSTAISVSLPALLPGTPNSDSGQERPQESSTSLKDDYDRKRFDRSPGGQSVSRRARSSVRPGSGNRSARRKAVPIALAS